MSNFFKSANTTPLPEPMSVTSLAILAKLFASPTGAIVADTDAAWAEVLRVVTTSVQSFGFQPVLLGPVEDSALYEKVSTFSILPEPAGFSWQNKSFFVRFNILYSLLKTYQTVSSAKTQDLNKWYAVHPAVQTGNKGALVADWQLAVTTLGESSVIVEAQLVCALWEICRLLGLESRLQLDVNNIGSTEAQKNYASFLSQYLQPKRYNLCDSCGEYLTSNPLEVLRCRQLDCQALLSGGPVILDSLDEESQKRLTQYLEALEELGIPYQLNPTYAGPRGAGGTCFALRVRIKDKLTVFAEGFRVNDILQGVAGKNHAGFGALGSLSVLRDAAAESLTKPTFEVYLVPLGELAVRKSLRLMRNLVMSGVSVYDCFGINGVKNQLKHASDAKGKIALIMGQREALEEKVIIRDILGGIQETFHFDQVVEEVKKRLGR